MNMLQELADLYGCEPTEEAIRRAVYKGTACGAWVHFPAGKPNRVEIGSIVEGSDAEVRADPVLYEDGGEAFIARYREAIEYVEGEAVILWDEANSDEED